MVALAVAVEVLARHTMQEGLGLKCCLALRRRNWNRERAEQMRLSRSLSYPWTSISEEVFLSHRLLEMKTAAVRQRVLRPPAVSAAPRSSLS
jgi:hypothetical protein